MSIAGVLERIQQLTDTVQQPAQATATASTPAASFGQALSGALSTSTAGGSSAGALQWDAAITAAAERNGVDPALARAVVQHESGFDPSATSPVGAMGLMQLMPSTARGLGVTNPYDPLQSLDGGTRLLRQLLDRYHGDVSLALAAYNAGTGAVDQYGGVPPYPETQSYVRNILASLSSTSADPTQAMGLSPAAADPTQAASTATQLSLQSLLSSLSPTSTDTATDPALAALDPSQTSIQGIIASLSPSTTDPTQGVSNG